MVAAKMLRLSRTEVLALGALAGGAALAFALWRRGRQATGVTGAGSSAPKTLPTRLQPGCGRAGSGESGVKKAATPVAELPVIDLGRFLSRDEDPAAAQAECVKAAVAMRKYGALVVRDPRVSASARPLRSCRVGQSVHGKPKCREKRSATASETLRPFPLDPKVNQEENERFLDMMERYFAMSDGVRDARPEVAYQVGVTPGGVEKPRDHSLLYDRYNVKDRCVHVVLPCGSSAALDRFFFRSSVFLSACFWGQARHRSPARRGSQVALLLAGRASA
eukprot:scaffold907_cov247-Pinguiococcus_pyrenoidosus.AAC.11